MALPGRSASARDPAFNTTRGDRLFISLLLAAYLHLIWLALMGPPLWGATALSLRRRRHLPLGVTATPDSAAPGSLVVSSAFE